MFRLTRIQACGVSLLFLLPISLHFCFSLVTFHLTSPILYMLLFFQVGLDNVRHFGEFGLLNLNSPVTSFSCCNFCDFCIHFLLFFFFVISNNSCLCRGNFVLLYPALLLRTLGLVRIINECSNIFLIHSSGQILPIYFVIFYTLFKGISCKCFEGRWYVFTPM